MRMFAIIFGIIFFLVGVLGFIPAATPNGYLLGLFEVNTMHNIVHILTGIAFIVVGLISFRASQIFFRIFGFIYLLIAIIGFIAGDRPILGMSNNIPDAWLHLVLAIAMIGISFKRR